MERVDRGVGEILQIVLLGRGPGLEPPRREFGRLVTIRSAERPRTPVSELLAL